MCVMCVIVYASEMENLLLYVARNSEHTMYGGRTIKGIVMPNKDVVCHMHLEVVTIHLHTQQ